MGQRQHVLLPTDLERVHISLTKDLLQAFESRRGLERTFAIFLSLMRSGLRVWLLVIPPVSNSSLKKSEISDESAIQSYLRA